MFVILRSDLACFSMVCKSSGNILKISRFDILIFVITIFILNKIIVITSGGVLLLFVGDFIKLIYFVIDTITESSHGYRGVKPIDKREGAGAHNWGSHKDVIE